MFRFKQFLSEGKKRNIDLAGAGERIKPFFINLPQPETRNDEHEELFHKILRGYQRDDANSTGSTTINKVLRDNPDFMKKPDDDQMYQRIGILDRLFAKHGTRLNKPFTVFRGTHNVESGIHPAFLSTTLDKGLAYDFATTFHKGGRGKVLKLTVPEGTPFLKMPSSGGSYDKENEILFPRDVHLDINPKSIPTRVLSTFSERTPYNVPLHRGIIRYP